MLVRGTDRAGEWFEERTSSENLCRGGAARELIVGVEFIGPRFHRMFVSESTS
jgi:hypothetical protein